MRRVVDKVVAVVPAGSVIPLAATLVVSNDGLNWWLALAGLVLAWAAGEIRIVRASTRCTP